jgi:hypothetical protein
MADIILDDVKELLLNEQGDAKILERIKRAAENDEVISVYERDYVNDLTKKYLRPKYEPEPIEEINKESEETSEQVSETISEASVEKSKPTKPLFESKIKNPKTTKYAFAIGAIALSIILIVGVSQSGISDFPTSTTTQSTQTTMILVINTDVSSYELGDIISISGNSDPSLGNTIELSIENADGNVIWTEDVKIKSSGVYSTLVIAGGSGWEKSGEYSLKAEHESEQNQLSFNFKA